MVGGGVEADDSDSDHNINNNNKCNANFNNNYTNNHNNCDFYAPLTPVPPATEASVIFSSSSKTQLPPCRCTPPANTLLWVVMKWLGLRGLRVSCNRHDDARRVMMMMRTPMLMRDVCVVHLSRNNKSSGRFYY